MTLLLWLPLSPHVSSPLCAHMCLSCVSIACVRVHVCVRARIV